jgi:hypothetical protein
MLGKNCVGQLIDRSAENPAGQRRFLKRAGAAGLGVVGSLGRPGGREVSPVDLDDTETRDNIFS